MKYFNSVFAIVFLIALGGLRANGAPMLKKAEKIISDVKKEFAPDKREAIFRFEFSEKGSDFFLTGETNLPKAKEKLNALLKESKINFTDQSRLLPGTDLAGKNYAVVNLSVANMRSLPGYRHELGSQTLLGTPLKVYKRDENGWYLVQTPDNYIAWVEEGELLLMNREEMASYVSRKKIIFTAEYGFSFSSPDTKSLRVSDLVAGNLLSVESEEGSFYKVSYPDRRQAYVLKSESEDFVQWLRTRRPTGENIVNTAKLFMGLPYLWGGTSAKALDCSGFAKTSYFLNGVILARDASLQALTGEDVDVSLGYSNLCAGDLLFFGEQGSPTKPERITHVGIYMGNGEYIHESGMIHISSFDKASSKYDLRRHKSFVRARRILSSLDTKGISLIKNNNFYKGIFE